MNKKQILYFVLSIILFFIVYNLYKTCNNKNNEYFDNIENFKSKLEGFKKKNNKNKNNNNDSKKLIKKMKSKTSGTTFDELFKATEDMDSDKFSISNMQKELSKYYDSFKKEKFKNNSKSTAESFEKFAFYKEQFFNIFK